MTDKMTYEELEQRVKELEESVMELNGSAREREYHKSLEEDLLWEVEVSASISDLASKLLMPNSIEDISSLVLEHASYLTSSPHGYVAYLDPQTGHLVSAATTSERADRPQVRKQRTVFKTFNGLWGQVLESGKSLVANRAVDENGYSETPLGPISVHRFLSAPALIEEKVVGQITLANSVREYNERDLLLVKRLAVFYAFAVERSWTDRALIESEGKYRELANSLPQVVFETDEKGTLTFVNRNAFDFFGYTKKDFNKGLNTLQMITPSDRNRAMENILRVLSGEKFDVNKYTALRKDGSTFPIAVHANPIVHEDRAMGLRGIIIDLTEHKLAEEELDGEREKFRLLVEKSPLGVCLIGKGAHYKYINPKFIEMFGYTLEDIPTGQEWFKKAFPDPEYRKQVISTWIRDLAESKADESRPRTFTVRCKDGTEKVIYFFSVTRASGDQFILTQDITEQTRLESQLRQAQKMEAIGTLSGGIAHDFNNILSAIMGYTELSMFEALDGSPTMDKLNEILKASHRARDMVRQILGFSRQNKQERIPIEVSPIVKEALKMLRASLPTTIEIRHHIDNGLGIVEADATQIHQVLMNLSTNAAHAMNEKGGILEIGLTNVDVDAANSARHSDLRQGPYVRLTVSDTGHGMTRDVMERIFEPYFTTKEKGVGTGMGLAVTHGIVKSHGGAITLESKPGKGSTFNVYIPRIEKEVTPKAGATEFLPTGSERILFVDDEQALVEIGEQMLEKLGYEVTTRTSSIEALELFRAQPDRFDFVITDMTMPNMTGEKLAKELMGIRADIPIVLCTGYSERIGRESAEKMGIREFVMKPLSMNELANAIRNGIDKG